MLTIDNRPGPLRSHPALFLRPGALEDVITHIRYYTFTKLFTYQSAGNIIPCWEDVFLTKAVWKRFSIRLIEHNSCCILAIPCQNIPFLPLPDWLVDYYFPGCPASLTLSSPKTLLAAMNLSIKSATLFPTYTTTVHQIENTYKPPCQLPSPRIASAWTLVIRSKFSVSDRFDDNCASWEFSCA